MEYKEEYDAVKMGELVAKKLSGQLSEKEEETLNSWLRQSPDYQKAYEQLAQQDEDHAKAQIRVYDVNTALDRVLNKHNKPFIKKKRTFWYAASVVLLLGMSAYWFLNSQNYSAEEQLTSQYGNDVLPGKDQATLTLSNGETIVLSDSKDGIIIDNTAIRYSDGSEVAAGKSDIQYAVLSTPRKGQYQIRLPDGSKVWLNAESSLRYPNTFTGSERRVELKGEGYFEVAHNAEQPFIIETESQHLKVLGTSFNLNAYSNEPSTVTTLVTGSIEVGSKKSKAVKRIKPAQQAILESNSFRIEPVDVRPFVAWKEGEFRFKDTPLHEALRQIERWYDIEVDYDNIPKDIEIYAFIRRDKKLSSVLFALEKITDLKFTIRERRLMLME